MGYGVGPEQNAVNFVHLSHIKVYYWIPMGIGGRINLFQRLKIKVKPLEMSEASNVREGVELCHLHSFMAGRIYCPTI